MPKSPPVQAEARPPEQENAPYIKTPYTMPAAPAFNEKPNSTLLYGLEPLYTYKSEKQH